MKIREIDNIQMPKNAYLRYIRFMYHPNVLCFI